GGVGGSRRLRVGVRGDLRGGAVFDVSGSGVGNPAVRRTCRMPFRRGYLSTIRAHSPRREFPEFGECIPATRVRLGVVCTVPPCPPSSTPTAPTAGPTSAPALLHPRTSRWATAGRAPAWVSRPCS